MPSPPFARHPDPLPVLVAVGVAAVVLAGARWLPRIPLSLVAVAVVTALAAVLHWRLPFIGALPPLFSAPTGSFFNASELTALLPSAAAVAALAALESLLCATVADGMTIGERHDPDRELFGQGPGEPDRPVLRRRAGDGRDRPHRGECAVGARTPGSPRSRTPSS